MVQFNIRLPLELKNKLEYSAKKSYRKESAVYNLALKEYLPTVETDISLYPEINERRQETKLLSLRLDDELYNKLDTASKSTEKKMSQIFKYCLTRYLDENK